ncbi:cell cycle transcriptional regulator TrcR [Sandarakinorhabdus sp.]|uniref:cell cycle transcriptional regulator TrcR n=1 Tax=Sandarakinorhabdus sp. TaxID=1916663 RepID=UPI00286D6E06|nr:cell cycle transcriptional regulator TrcR [Sandarakinorhabdus sp.]
MAGPATPLMPHATAAWLVDNSALTFEQIADYCGLHVLEIQAIADDTAATKLAGRDPLRAGELTADELARGQADPDYVLKMARLPEQARRTSGPRYTPVSKRQDKPDGILWIIKNHAEITDNQISKLIGTTKTTIAAIRDKSHWNYANLQPRDPVTLGLTSQREMDALVAAAAKKAGIDMTVDPAKVAEERAAMIEQLQTERAAAAYLAEHGAPVVPGTGTALEQGEALFRR